MAVDIYIEGQRIDLFEDENITVNSNAQDVNDISKVFMDFSQTFSVPASPNNNNIFERWYNADINDGFDARTRKDSAIFVSTLTFKVGKMALSSSRLTENDVSFYKLTFFGNTVKIKDLTGDDKFKELTWLDNFNHDYTAANVKTGLTTGLDFTVDSVVYTKAVCYPLVSYARQYLYNSDPSDTTSTDKLVNIGYDAGRVDGINFGELRPAIRISIIIQAITEKYGLNFTGSFFTSQRFTDTYINVNNTKDSLSNGIKVYEELSGSQPMISNVEDRYKYYTVVTPDPGFTTVPYKIRLTVLGQVVYESSTWLTGTNSKSGSKIQWVEDYTVKAEVITEADFDFTATTRLVYLYSHFLSTDVFNNSYTTQSIDLDTIIKDQFKEIKVYDFLVSIIKLFNLVIVPDGDDLYVQDLQSWYAEGAIYDITPFVSTKEIDINKGKILSQINFKFEQSDQILADVYKQQNGVTYGNLENELFDESGNLLDGDSLDIEVLFEQPIFERLDDLNTGTEINLLYGLMLTDSLDTFVGEPFLMYLPSVSVAGNPLGYLGTSYDEINTTVLMPSHSLEYDTESFNLNFNAEINEFTSQVFFDTIYDRYYSDYIGDIFSIKRRMYNFSAILPNSLLSKLKLNDRLVIGNTRYIQNSTTSNIVNRADELELINDIYDAPLASDSLNSSLWNPTGSTYSGSTLSGDGTYIGLATATLSLVDTGDGTAWVTITGTINDVINIVTFTMTQNNTGLTRSLGMKATDSINDPIFTITQDTIGVSFDNDVVKFDNNINTWDEI